MKNINKILIFTFILIIGLNFIYATDNNTINQNNIIDQNNNIAQDTIHEKNTPIQNEEKTIIKENKTIKQESKAIILNSSTFDTYVTNRTFNENVSDGDTIDIQGILDGGRFSLNVNKPLNIISSTHNAYIDVDTKSAGFFSSNDANDYAFVISNGGSGSNISDLTFHNTHIYTTNAQNITITNITADCNQAVGVGRGMISIREESRNITIRNSYFETFPNGGHSNVVFAYAHDCLFENNTVKGHGFVGDLVYITSYGSSTDTGETNQTYCNSNITIRNNYLDGTDATDNGICVGVVIEGANHTIVNNTILKTNYFMTQINDYGTNTANITFKDNYCPLGQIEIINITDDNYETYGSLNDDLLELNENITNKHINIKTTRIQEIYSQYPVDIIAINNTVTKLILNYENIEINDLYAPDTTLIVKNTGNITNSTLKAVIADDSRTIISNNIIVNNGELLEDNLASILLRQTNNQTIIKNNYLLTYNEDNVLCGENAITKISGSDEILENNTPYYSNIHILNTTTYNNLFDDECILREEIEGTIIITDSISQPIIINKPINLTSQMIPGEDKQLRGLLWGKFTIDSPYCFVYPKVYRIINKCNNIIFTNGSEQSNLTNTYAEKIIINNTSVNIKNNNINDTIQIINSTYNNITKNNITTNNQYTIILDETSTENTIQNNYLVPFKDYIWIKENGFTVKNTSINTFGDLSIYHPQENTIVNNTPLNDVNITLDCDDTIPIIPTPITINITSNNESVKNGYVIVLFNGTQIAKENLTNGYLETNITPTTTGNQTLKIYYFADKLYNNTSTSKTIEVLKANATITIESESNLTIGETITIKATIQSPQINNINNQTLTFKVTNTQHNTTITNNEATITIKTNDTWNNGIYATLDQSLFNSTQSNTIKLEKGEANIKATQKITDNNITITAYITDTGNTPLSKGYIRFKNGTKNLRMIQIVNGTAEYSIPITEGIEGTIITLSLTNNNAINNKDKNITLTLNPPTITNTKIEPINGKKGQPTTITATITTQNNTPVTDGSVTFTTTDYTETVPVENGIATITHTFTQTLNDTITATYTPADATAYYESTNTTTITITKDPENITIILTPITGKTNEETTITATITTQNNTPINQGQITFTTTNYTETVQVTNGTATTTHTFTQTLNNTITATYTPENPEDYNIQTNITTVTITEENKKLTLKIDTKNFIINQNNTITASIYQGDDIQNNITGGKVVFKVNGKSLKDSNGKVIYAKVVNGTASIENYTIPPTWNKENILITAVYSGYKEYTSLRSQEEQITLTTPTPTLTLTPITSDIQSGSTIKIEAKVTNGDTSITTGKIVFKLNGKTLKDTNVKLIYAQVDSNGTVSFDYNIGNLKVNTYKLTATFIANGYDKLEANTTINVVKA